MNPVGVVLVLFLPLYTAIPIDNGVTGNPDVVCMEDGMKVLLNTEKPFRGQMFVKSQLFNPSCHLDMSATRDSVTNILLTIPYRDCLVNRIRNTNPAGMTLVAVVIVQFHTVLLTKVDQAYKVRCFYQELSKKVEQSFSVSMLPTTEIYQTQAMPRCSYNVLRGSVNGSPVRFASIGDKVFHVWSCDRDEGGYGMLVHSCVARDTVGNAYRLLDANGCALDPTALTNLHYERDLEGAWVEAHVFRFASEMMVSFKCEVRICIKAEGGCASVTPPRCSDSHGHGSNSVDHSHQTSPLPPPTRIYGRPPNTTPSYAYRGSTPGQRPFKRVRNQQTTFAPYSDDRLSQQARNGEQLIESSITSRTDPNRTNNRNPNSENQLERVRENKLFPPPPGRPFDSRQGRIDAEQRPWTDFNGQPIFRPPGEPTVSEVTGVEGGVGRDGDLRNPWGRQRVISQQHPTEPHNNDNEPQPHGLLDPNHIWNSNNIPILSTFRPQNIFKDSPYQEVSGRGEMLGSVEVEGRGRMESFDPNPMNLDLKSEEMFVFNLDDSFSESLASDYLNLTTKEQDYINNGRNLPWAQQTICMTRLKLIQILTALILTFCAIITIMAFCQRRYYLQKLAMARLACTYTC